MDIFWTLEIGLWQLDWKLGDFWVIGGNLGQFHLTSFSRNEFIPWVLIDFERVCYVSLQKFEKAVNLSFQN